MALRILVIDDDPHTTGALQRLLTKVGYCVEVENVATRAFETARTFQPEVVILDFSMPKVHGGDVAWQLASDPRLRTTRVIMCTGCGAEEIRNKLPPQPIEILEKPVNEAALLQLLRECSEALTTTARQLDSPEPAQQQLLRGA